MSAATLQSTSQPRTDRHYSQHVDEGVDGGGGDGSELTRWGRVGVGAGKERGVAAAKMVSRRVKPFVVVDGDVTRSEVGRDEKGPQGPHGWGWWSEK